MNAEGLSLGSNRGLSGIDIELAHVPGKSASAAILP
jgi:hypothetical protein